MSITGYAPWRARDHEAFTVAHQGMWPYIDAKTGGPNIAWELNDFHAWMQIALTEGERVYIVHQATPESPWTVDTPLTLGLRVIGGPRRRSGDGSKDDWYLSKAGGTPFDEYFPLGETI
jgi:hypothetical protein